MASTSRATPSCCGSRASTRRRSPGSASTRTYPLRSSFSPTYNMAVNLVRQMGRHTAREVLETSFAQFQADRAVVGLARQLRKNEEALAGYAEAMSCHLGDFVEYASIRRALSDREKQLAREDTASRERRSLRPSSSSSSATWCGCRWQVVASVGSAWSSNEGARAASRARDPSCSPRTARCASSPPATSSTRRSRSSG